MRISGICVAHHCTGRALSPERHAGSGQAYHLVGARCPGTEMGRLDRCPLVGLASALRAWPRHGGCSLQGRLHHALTGVGASCSFVMRTDIRGYYQHIDKELVLYRVVNSLPSPVCRDLVHQYLYYSVEEGGEFYTPTPASGICRCRPEPADRRQPPLSHRRGSGRRGILTVPGQDPERQIGWVAGLPPLGSGGHSPSRPARLPNPIPAAL